MIKGEISEHQSGAVYSVDDVAPTLTASHRKEAVKIIVSDNEPTIDWINMNGTEKISEGDGVVVVRPHLARKTVMHDCGFAVTRDPRNGVCVMDNLKIAGKLSGTNVAQAKNVYDVDGNAPACMTAGGSGSKTKIAVDEIPEMDDGDVISVQTPGRSVKSQNGSRFKEDTSFTVTAAEKDGVVEKSEGKLRIRYLTPRECLRLQAFPDDAIDKLEGVLSKTAMYKVAGNSIAVCCLKSIFKGIYIDKTFKKSGRQVTLNEWL